MFQTLLRTVSDKWLHYTTRHHQFRFYEASVYPPSAPPSDPLSDPSDPYASSYVLSNACQDFLISDMPTASLPCFITQNNSVLDVAQPMDAYLLVLTGVSRMTSDYGNADFTAYNSSAGKNEGTFDLIVDHIDPETSLIHSIFFFLGSSSQSSIKNKTLGIDYVAYTTFMVTECEYVTHDYQIFNATNSSAADTFLHYNCSTLFQGDLGQLSSASGHIEAVRGWNTNFYEIINGTQQNVSLQAPLNPFPFYAVADINSYPYSVFDSYDPEDTEDGFVVDPGSNHLAFALNCTATIHDVSFSLINGDIVQFNATPSDPKKASIIRAPLQAGFGANYLYQQASLAAISTEPLIDLMASAFSHAGLASSFGAFTYGVNAAQRGRYDLTVTKVNKAALIFQATVCILYAAIGVVIMVLGLAARRHEEVRRYQAELLPPVVVEPLSWSGWLAKIMCFTNDDAYEAGEAA